MHSGKAHHGKGPKEQDETGFLFVVSEHNVEGALIFYQLARSGLRGASSNVTICPTLSLVEALHGLPSTRTRCAFAALPIREREMPRALDSHASTRCRAPAFSTRTAGNAQPWPQPGRARTTVGAASMLCAGFLPAAVCFLEHRFDPRFLPMPS